LISISKPEILAAGVVSEVMADVPDPVMPVPVPDVSFVLIWEDVKLKSIFVYTEEG
jgi:hypothetical protein